MTWLGLLNFIVLQWFGVRLARATRVEQRNLRPDHISLTEHGLTTAWRCDVKHVHFWKLLRWVWPLTGWWSPYRWIKRPRPKLVVLGAPTKMTVRLSDEATPKLKIVHDKLDDIERRR